MEKKLNVNINIEGTQITHFSSFTLDQRFNAHHYFELRFKQVQFGMPLTSGLESSRAYMGKTLTIQFGPEGGEENVFSGTVTKIELAQSHGYQGDIIASGYSPSILIDRGPDLGSYLGQTLSSIVQKATADAPSNDLKMSIKPQSKSPIDYIIQYRESDFDFINRLSAEYHEWFFYDGQKLNFGKPDKLKDVKLVYGRDISDLQYALHIAPLNYKKFSYSPKDNKLLTSEVKGKETGSTDLKHSISASNLVFSKSYNQPIPIRVNSKKEAETFVQNEQQALISELVKVIGHGDNPLVSLGCIADISMSVKEILNFTTQNFGKFLITAVKHHIDGLGHYKNTFEGISSEAEYINVHDAKRPMAEMQLANVVDNKDPDGNGRVKVKFKWECTSNDVTEWLRVVTPDAGSSDKVSKNRGFVFVPENGDQVVVAFEEGNVARPFVLGSVFHGESGSGGGADNNSKSISSKSGHSMQLDDGAGMTFIDKSKLNHIVIDGTNAIKVTADKTIVLKTGQSSITLNSDGTIDISGVIINIKGTTAVNINSEKITGAAVTIGTKGQTAVNVLASTLNEEAQGAMTNCSETSISSTTNGPHTITGTNVDIN